MPPATNGCASPAARAAGESPPRPSDAVATPALARSPRRLTTTKLRPGSGSPDRLPGPPADDQVVPLGQALEALQIGRQVPGQGAGAADDAVLGDGGDER